MLDGVYRWNWDGTGAVLIISSKEVGGQPITKARWSPDSSQNALPRNTQPHFLLRCMRRIQCRPGGADD